MLNIQQLTKRFGHICALDTLTLHIQESQISAILAKNGAGKSTLMSVIAGLSQPCSGSININGLNRLDKKNTLELKKHIGFAAQNTGLYPTLSVYQNVYFFAKLHGLKHQQAKLRVEQLLKQFELTDLTHRPCQTLSGGQKRRVHLAIAVVHRPKLLLLDEPTLGADIYAREAILTVVKDIAAQGTAVIYTTHYLNEVENLDAHIIIMDKGRVLHQASQRELHEKYNENAFYIDFNTPIANKAAQVIAHSTAVSAARLYVKNNKATHTVEHIVQQMGHFLPHVQQIKRHENSLEHLFFNLTTSTAPESASTATLTSESLPTPTATYPTQSKEEPAPL